MGGALLMADAKKPAQGQKDKRPMVALDPELHRKLKLVCADTGVQIQDFVHAVLSPVVDREHKAKFPDRKA